MKKILPLLFVVMIATKQTPAQVNVQDSLALVDLYNSTDGPNWAQNANWLAGPVSTWHGVTIQGTRVTRLDLEQGNLNGTLPASIGDLVELRYLNLGDNKLTGGIPSSIGNLININDILLYANMLTGSIPSSIGNLTNLGGLDLAGNRLTGEIPSSIGNIWLWFISLAGNQLTGTIPASFVNLTDCMIFLNNNQLTGPIPEELCRIEAMWILSNNQFTFDGLECLRGYYGDEYTNQKQLSITNNNPVLSVYAGGTLSNNTYTWYKDVGTAPYAVIEGDSTITLTEPGTYWAAVNNSMLTALTLFTDTIVISQVSGQDPLEFSAEKCGGDVCMTWFAWQDHKQAISHFDVEKSTNGSYFKKTDRIKASRKNGKQRYAARDYFPAWGTNYYRVKQVNKNGTFVYSKVITVEIPKPVFVYIWPNPADGYIYFKGVDKAKKVTIYSLNGQTIKQWQNVNAYQPLNISSLRRGIYIVKITHATGEAVQLILKK